MTTQEILEILDSIVESPQNWSKKVREACRAGAKAIREQEKLNRLLKRWEEQP